MKILVPIRRIPDPDRPIMVVDNAVDVVRRIISPHDEAAVDFARTLHSDVIVAAFDEESLLSGLARGAHHGYLVNTNVDPRSTAHALAEIFRRENADLVLMGHNPLDSGETAPRLAGMLGIPQATSVSAVHINGSAVLVERDLDRTRETLDMSLPAVIALAPAAEPPAIVSLRAIVDARDRRIDRIAIDVPPIARVETIAVEPGPVKRSCRMIDSVDELVDALREEARVI